MSDDRAVTKGTDPVPCLHAIVLGLLAHHRASVALRSLRASTDAFLQGTAATACQWSGGLLRKSNARRQHEHRCQTDAKPHFLTLPGRPKKRQKPAIRKSRRLPRQTVARGFDRSNPNVIKGLSISRRPINLDRYDRGLTKVTRPALAGSVDCRSILRGVAAIARTHDL